MNPLHLLWIIPLTASAGAFFGFMLCALLTMAKVEDERMQRLYDE